jgi:orotate phosphoribosyltransferase
MSAPLASLRADAIRFFVAEGVLSFGDFTLKSGRRSPYFFNTGKLCSGRQLAEMGRLYAAQISATAAFGAANVVFGSAYKGIPIAVATAIAAARETDRELRAVSDRKEAKQHGDASSFLGVLQSGDRAVIVDDVITTGGTKVEAIDKLRAAGCEPLGVVVAFDRVEPATPGGPTAREALEREIALPVLALLSAHDLVAADSSVPAEAQHRLRQHLADVARLG